MFLWNEPLPLAKETSLSRIPALIYKADKVVIIVLQVVILEYVGKLVVGVEMLRNGKHVSTMPNDNNNNINDNW